MLVKTNPFFFSSDKWFKVIRFFSRFLFCLRFTYIFFYDSITIWTTIDNAYIYVCAITNWKKSKGFRLPHTHTYILLRIEVNCKKSNHKKKRKRTCQRATYQFILLIMLLSKEKKQYDLVICTRLTEREKPSNTNWHFS